MLLKWMRGIVVKRKVGIKKEKKKRIKKIKAEE